MSTALIEKTQVPGSEKLQARIPGWMVMHLDLACDQQSVTRSHLVRRLLTEGLSEATSLTEKEMQAAWLRAQADALEE